jgi:translation elongation factor EF-1alpha
MDEMPVDERKPNAPLRIPVLEKVSEIGIIAHGKVE